MGVDGSTVEVTIGDRVAGLTFWWWVYVPAEWQALGKIVDEVMRIASAAQEDPQRGPAENADSN
jgi:hypothetical protein